MWPFKSKKPVEDTTANERLVRMEKRIDRLEEDWTEVYGKFRTLQMRVAKQVQRLDADSSQEEPQGAESDGVRPQPHSSLSPRQRQIQNEILERRRRGGGAPVAREGGE
jgi:hypothetical protein